MYYTGVSGRFQQRRCISDRMTKGLMMEEELRAIIENQKRIRGQNSELIFSQVFHDTIKGSAWLPGDFALSPGRGALGYPALYVLYRVLDEFHPKSILEMGMGQSTKMIGMYNQNTDKSEHIVVEHDAEWISFFCNHFELPAHTRIVELPIIDAPISMNGVSQNVTMYYGFAEKFEGKTFDFICIDGPYGFRSPEYARIDIISILPECLENSFVILLDDCDRTGEMNTLRLVSGMLDNSGIKHAATIYEGEKKTGLIVSENLSFLCMM